MFKMKYEIYRSSSNKYAIKLEKWGFLNRGWSGANQAITNDPNDAMVFHFDSEEEAREQAKNAVKDFLTDTWEKI